MSEPERWYLFQYLPGEPWHIGKEDGRDLVSLCRERVPKASCNFTSTGAVGALSEDFLAAVFKGGPCPGCRTAYHREISVSVAPVAEEMIECPECRGQSPTPEQIARDLERGDTWGVCTTCDNTHEVPAPTPPRALKYITRGGGARRIRRASTFPMTYREELALLHTLREMSSTAGLASLFQERGLEGPEAEALAHRLHKWVRETELDYKAMWSTPESHRESMILIRSAMGDGAAEEHERAFQESRKRVERSRAMNVAMHSCGGPHGPGCHCPECAADTKACPACAEVK